MSAIKNIRNNDISTYKNMYVMETRKRIYEIEKEDNRKVILRARSLDPSTYRDSCK